MIPARSAFGPKRRCREQGCGPRPVVRKHCWPSDLGAGCLHPVSDHIGPLCRASQISHVDHLQHATRQCCTVMKQKRRSPRCLGSCNKTGPVTITFFFELPRLHTVREHYYNQCHSAFTSLAQKGTACSRSSTFHILCKNHHITAWSTIFEYKTWLGVRSDDTHITSLKPLDNGMPSSPVPFITPSGLVTIQHDLKARINSSPLVKIPLTMRSLVKEFFHPM
ncbi:hypothetical protein JVT61DRAFT_14802 [Boletus reticuloceps]|uniref:Uncharacterized protein n=1 Tax=Boletus reticuloceps TaxID=495285 RepID=A0A8I2YRV5_9AGAM|nr:hypothetical protein JVT61DRAFT_14802 [Boletus reticuloceps]